MLRISFIRKNKEKILKGLEKRNFSAKNLIYEFFFVDTKRRELLTQYNKCIYQKNIFSKKIECSFKEQKYNQANVLIRESLQLKKDIKNIEKKLLEVEAKIEHLLLKIPNLPSEEISEIKEVDNDIIYSYGIIHEKKLPLWEIAKKFELIDWELGPKISGSGFPVYIGKCARLQRALIQYFLDYNNSKGYNEYSLPHLVNEVSARGTGQFPDKACQMYYIPKDKFYLIPTGEVPLINCFRNKLLFEKNLPIKATTYTLCFRREAGSYGSNVRNLNRLHQFDKVEIIQITTPETSSRALEEMVEHVKQLLIAINLPFRVLRLSAKDMSFTSAMTYDVEVYSSGQNRWLEVSSISNCTDYQSNRLKLRYKNKKGKISLCHTLNGSSLALPRIIAAILENFQYEDCIMIPQVLIPYTGFDQIRLPI